MTIRESLRDTLTENGLWQDEAEDVIDRYAAQVLKAGGMTDRWNEPTTSIPDATLAALEVAVKGEAVEYLLETKPNHFALTMLRV